MHLEIIAVLVSFDCYSCALTQDLSTVYDELRASGKFEDMDLSVDEAEHSMEMHLPYLAKVFRG